jgi:hypothetical protein
VPDQVRGTPTGGQVSVGREDQLGLARQHPFVEALPGPACTGQSPPGSWRLNRVIYPCGSTANLVRTASPP